jgi:hypothetical protein
MILDCCLSDDLGTGAHGQGQDSGSSQASDSIPLINHKSKIIHQKSEFIRACLALL